MAESIGITEEQANQICGVCGHPRGYHTPCDYGIEDLDEIIVSCGCPEFKRTPKGVRSDMTHRPVITIRLQPRQGFNKISAEKHIRERLELMPTDEISFHFEQEAD